MQECLNTRHLVYMDHLESTLLSLNDEASDEMQSVEIMLECLQLSMEARCCLRAAGECEKQRCRNKVKINANYRMIQEALEFLSNYCPTCEIRGVGYYCPFKLQRDSEDFNANVKRLELVGLWDGIVEMLRRYERPDNFEGRAEWVELGTRYRRLVKPLDIANYYRHSKNEDTGPYMVKGRPKRYTYTQRWLEQAQRMPSGSSQESCFWAIVEELCLDTSNKPFEEVRDRLLELEEEILLWLTTGKLCRDVLLDETTFVRWWKTLPKPHTLESHIARLMNSENLG